MEAQPTRPLLSESRAARRTTYALLGLHALLLALSLPDYRTSIDNGYHTALARQYAEHGTAFWDSHNFGPGGRPNLNAPLQHMLVGALGRVLGGEGDDYVEANALLGLLQWAAAMATVVWFARRLAGDWAALLAAALASGSAFAAGSFYVGIPSGWVFILAPWAIHFFLARRLALATAATAACIYFHLGGYATAPLGLAVAAALRGRWRELAWVGGASALLTAPYSVHFLRHLDWYAGERGHVAFVAEPLIVAFTLAGAAWTLRRPRERAQLVGWLAAGLPWLVLHPSRFLLQCALVGGVTGGAAAVQLSARIPRPHLRAALRGSLAALAALFPLAPPSLGAEALWLAGFDFPRQIDWGELRQVARAIQGAGLEGELLSVYSSSVGSGLAVYAPVVQEKGHWVEVRPRSDPADALLAGAKTYVVPIPPGDPVLQSLARERFVAVHGGGRRDAVVTLGPVRASDEGLTRLAAVLAGEARALAAGAENNVLGDPVALFLEEGALDRRRARFAAQRAHAGRLEVAWLVYAHALEPLDREAALRATRQARGLGALASFLSDESAIGFVSAARHQRLREHLATFAGAAEALSRDPTSPAPADALQALFDDYFWAA